MSHRSDPENEATAHLRSVDPIMADLIDRIGPCRLVPSAEGTHFEALARAIVYQQLSGKAAETIYRRFAALCAPNSPDPEGVLSLEIDSLRAAGLSRQKTLYLRDLAEHCVDGRLAVDDLHHLEDDAVMEQVTAVKGVGRWTAQMFLLFRLGRPDILSELDLGIRKAIRNLYALDEFPLPARVLELGAPWSPYRSVASWYLWRSLE